MAYWLAGYIQLGPCMAHFLSLCVASVTINIFPIGLIYLIKGMILGSKMIVVKDKEMDTF